MTRAMILCAGFGTRMEGLTANFPKPMLPLGERPLLEYTIANLKRVGIIEIGINLHYLADKITDYFGDGNKFGVKITYTYEDAPSGTAGGVKKLQGFLSQSENFLVLYGDVLTTQNFSTIRKFHIEKNGKATILLHRRKKSNSIVKLDNDGRIIDFLERPSEPTHVEEESWVNSGIYCFSPGIFKFIPENSFCDFPRDIFPLLIEQRNLYGLPLNGYRCAIDTPDRYLLAQQDIDQYKFLLERNL